MSLPIESQIECILFVKGEPTAYSTLCDCIGCSPEELTEAVEKLDRSLQERGVKLVRTPTSVELATSPEASDLVEALNKKELTKKLGKAGLETLTIVLYQGPVSRRDIDYIRGVNSTSILRNLTIRGLIERLDAGDGRQAVLYQATGQLLRHLGIGNQAELPEYKIIEDEVKQYLNLEEGAGSENEQDSDE